MWRKEDGSPQTSSEGTSGPMTSTTAAKSGTGTASPTPISPRAVACVSQGIKIKGEITGNEDLFVDGLVEGSIFLGNSVLTVGPNANVKADITAREVVLRGRAEGKFTASERIQLWHTARVQADLKSERISIEDGAALQGKVEAGRATPAAPVLGSSGQSKKTDTSKASNSSSTDEKTTSGAATAKAD